MRTKRDLDPGKQRGGSPWLLGCAFSGLLAVVLVFSSLYLAADQVKSAAMSLLVTFFDSPAGSSSTEIVFTVQKGENASQIANRLDDQGLITNAEAFRLLARLRGLDQSLEAGDYRLRESMRLGEVLATLQRAGAGQNKLTILEGWRLTEIADEIDYRKLATRGDFLTLSASTSWSQSFLNGRPTAAGLEGYLFPDTYQLDKDMTARILVGRMLDNFEKRVMPVWNDRRPGLELTLHQVLTLASIVEREAQVPAERPLIASVYLNRLRIGMRLQADPTVQYALIGANSVATQGYWKKDLSRADLGLDSPYNTYMYAGLPPGPICNPGLAAVEAVLQPAQTDYLYFVAKGDGSHAFARTLEEHNQNVSQYSP
ncbi:MAG: endolytic transglycosylase MltG [Chloroflexota bacterium]